jgi:hypothetical protein
MLGPSLALLLLGAALEACGSGLPAAVPPHCHGLEQWWLHRGGHLSPGQAEDFVPPLKPLSGMTAAAGDGSVEQLLGVGTARPVHGAAALMAWMAECGQEGVQLIADVDAIFRRSARLLSVTSATSLSNLSLAVGPVEGLSVEERGELQALGLALFRHGLAREAATMRRRAASFGSGTPLHTVRAPPDQLPPSQLPPPSQPSGGAKGGEAAKDEGRRETEATPDHDAFDGAAAWPAQIQLVPRQQQQQQQQQLMMGTMLHNCSCLRPSASASSSRRHYDGELLDLGLRPGALSPGRVCAPQPRQCHERCALALADGLVTPEEAARLVRPHPLEYVL